MALSREDIAKLARLSKLKLSEEEITRLQKDLGQIVLYVERLSEIDVSDVAPMTHAIPMDLPTRADETKEVVGRQALMGSAGFEDGLVRVPKIIE